MMDGMKRRTLLATVVAAALAAATPVLAVGSADELVSQLRAQGYTDIDVTRTLLGRVRILARSDRQQREIIFNPRTGEILRDYWESYATASGGSGGSIIDPSDDDAGDDDNSGSGSGSSGSGSGSSNSDNDNDNDNDNSGSGSSGSGSGSSDNDNDNDN